MIFKWITTISTALLLVLLGCNKPKEESEENSKEDIRVPVKVSPLEKRSIESVISVVGATDAIRREKIYSPVAGKVIALKVLEGSHVRIGNVMLILRTKEAQAAFEGAQTLMNNASTELQKQEAQRAIALVDSVQPQICMRAHFDGIVASRNVMEGELVNEQSELLTVIDPSAIVFVADVPINSISEIRPELSARVKFPELQINKIDAVVDAVNPQAETQSQSVKVRLRFHNLSESQQKLLKFNLQGTAQIITGIHYDVFVVNRSLILHDDEANTYSMVIMTDDSLAKVIPVIIGIQTDSLIEVKSELLHPGINIIRVGQYALTDSTKVIVEQ
jgi:membrane fusion protein, multidrug efflux system